MDTPPEYIRLAEEVGISRSYAHEILSGTRTPSRSLALSIFQRTGRKVGFVAGMADDDIATLARIEGLAA